MKNKKIFTAVITAVLTGVMLFTSSVFIYGAAEPYLELPLDPEEWVSWNDIDNGPLSNENAYMFGEEEDGALVVRKKAAVANEEAVNAKYESESFSVEIDISNGLFLYYDLLIEAEEFAFAFHVGDTEVKFLRDAEKSDFAEGEKADVYVGKVDLVETMKNLGIDTSKGTVTLKNITIYVNGPAGDPVTIKRLGLGAADREVLTPTAEPTDTGVTETETPATEAPSTQAPTVNEPTTTVKPFSPNTATPEGAGSGETGSSNVWIYVVIGVCVICVVAAVVIVVAKKKKG